MKKIALIMIFLLVTLVTNAEKKVYVQKGDEFVLSEINIDQKSIKDVIRLLGHNPNVSYLWASKDLNYFYYFKINITIPVVIRPRPCRNKT